jgi:hypothetical protein
LGVPEAHPFESEIGVADLASTCLRQVAGKCEAGGATGFARGTSTFHKIILQKLMDRPHFL